MSFEVWIFSNIGILHAFAGWSKNWIVYLLWVEGGGMARSLILNFENFLRFFLI